MDPDAAVNPDDHERQRLEKAGRRRRELVELLGVALVGAEQAERDPRPEHVVGEQERDRQSENELRRLEACPAELPPFVERPEAEAHVGQERRIKRERARHGLPDQLLHPQALLHRRDGDVAERVVEEVQRHIGEEDEPAGEADLADARRMQAQRRSARSGVRGRRCHPGRNPWGALGPPHGTRTLGFRGAAHRNSTKSRGMASTARGPQPPAPVWAVRSVILVQPRREGADLTEKAASRDALPLRCDEAPRRRSAAVQPTQRLCRRRGRPDSARRPQAPAADGPEAGTAPEGPGVDAKEGWTGVFPC